MNYQKLIALLKQAIDPTVYCQIKRVFENHIEVYKALLEYRTALCQSRFNECLNKCFNECFNHISAANSQRSLLQRKGNDIPEYEATSFINQVEEVIEWGNLLKAIDPRKLFGVESRNTNIGGVF